MREHGPVPAYRALHPGGTHGLLGLGPGLVSKVLYFAGWNLSGGDNQPLILDQFVVIALNDHADLRWELDGKWSSDQYTASAYPRCPEAFHVRAIWPHTRVMALQPPVSLRTDALVTHWSATTRCILT